MAAGEEEREGSHHEQHRRDHAPGGDLGPPDTMTRSPHEAPTPRMEALARLPIFLALEAKRAVLVGGSAAAAWKAELLSAAGARVDVYAQDPCEELLAIAAEAPRDSIAIHARGFEPPDLNGAAIAVGAIEDETQAAAFAAAARRAGVPVNVVDKPALCDFAFGAIVNRSPLVIGISTDGAAAVVGTFHPSRARAAERYSGSCRARSAERGYRRRAGKNRLHRAGRRRPRRPRAVDAAGGTRAAVRRRDPDRRSRRAG